MAEYIEREKLLLALKEWQNLLIKTYGENDEYVRCLESVFIGIESAPAADVRDVVRCRDCVLRRYCNVAQYLGADGFCSNAVKRDEEGE